MNRITKLVSMVMIGLLAVTPALANLPCATGMHAVCAAGCPMAGETGPTCPMASQMAADGCAHGCCASTATQAITVPAILTKLHLATAAAPMALLDVFHAAEPISAIEAENEAQAASPPIFLRNQAFRI
jgi:hypothetical protein